MREGEHTQRDVQILVGLLLSAAVNAVGGIEVGNCPDIVLVHHTDTCSAI